ncbi:LysR family transcriptional regulator [Kribbella sp. NPDC004875]|uniref:LysR family transcriptional regulator n=1 Tax=Kribbella sp. NPDC004875 TaxID=3364107 RepID=UPI0036B70510
MRIEQLEFIAAVTQHGSLRRASEHLHISQPALSEAIAKLERELGVPLLDRRRSGARISAEGRDLLRNMIEVLEAVDRLKSAAGDRTAAARMLRIGTVNAGTSSLLLPALRRFQAARPGATVEIRNLQQSEIETSLAEGGLDVGLVNLLSGDDTPPGLEGTPVRHGHPVVVMPTGHELASRAEVTVDELRAEPFVGMRAGYVMHRFAHRIFGSALPRDWHSTDGAEMGKTMVAEGFGLTVLPDYSVTDDLLTRTGLITSRPIADDRTAVTMVVLQRRESRPTRAVQDLVATLTDPHDRPRLAS